MDIKTIIKIISEKENISYEEAEIEFDKIWNKPINEEKLDELAKNTRIYYDEYRIICKDEDEIYYAEDLDVVFKAGYRKAKEE